MSQPKPITQSFTFDDGREITLETGRLAKQADGAVTVRMGKAMLLATVVSVRDMKEPPPFFPLTVNYQEQFAAAGRIPGGFFKREGRPLDHEILICRLVDRALRPLFPDDYFAETQIIIQLISADDEVQPDALAALAASATLSITDIPFNGPISEVRVGRVKGKWAINPSVSDMENSDVDIIVAGNKDDVMMVEGEMQECSEEELSEAIKTGHEVIKKQCEIQEALAKATGMQDKVRAYTSVKETDEEMQKKVASELTDKIKKVISAGIDDKHERADKLKAIKNAFIESLSEEAQEEKGHIAGRYFNELSNRLVREQILKEGKRLDGRKTDQIRPLWMEVDYLPAAHGSAIFTRGETQALATVTLGNKFDEQMIDTAMVNDTKKFLLHYNFLPFCTGEAKFLRGPSRREVGHGNLANRALRSVLPNEDEYPYTIRIVSDILESNGSSSMATVCAGTLALMDAGVKITKPVAGIAMGMISDPDSGDSAILTDILGDEDHLGDMDFKVTGTRDGITACQMDIKIEGLSYDLLGKALTQAKDARMQILDAMEQAMPGPRTKLKPHVPRIRKVFVPQEFIGAIIGPGGKNIKEMEGNTDSTITINEIDGQGEVVIMGFNEEGIEKVVSHIKGISTPPEVGEVYEGKVIKLMPYGAFVEFLPGKEGLLHISEISWKHIDKVEDVFEPGDKVKVKLLDVDNRSGKFKLSRKAILPRPPRPEKETQSEQS